MANRKRQIPIIIMVNEREKALIEEKMRQLGTKNMGAYIRKMAIDGYVVRLDLSDISELVSLLRRSSNNLNQYAKQFYQECCDQRQSEGTDQPGQAHQFQTFRDILQQDYGS